MIDFFKKHYLPILFVLGGVLDVSTDLFVQLFQDLGAPNWVLSLFRVFIAVFGAFKLYYSTSPKDKNTSKDGDDLGGGGIKNPPKP